MGKELKILADQEMAQGDHHVTIEASSLPAGVYFYQLQANDKVETKKMILTK